MFNEAHPEERETVFDFEGQQIRVIELNGYPYWLASDLATILDFRDPYAATRTLDDDDKLLHIVSVAGQKRSTTLVSESGLYSMILQSRKESARRFKKWVTSEVLPAIRKTGSYSVANREHGLETIPTNDLAIAALTRLHEENLQLKRENTEMLPDYRAHKVLTERKGTYSFREAGHMVSKRIGYDIGGINLKKKAVHFGLLGKDKRAYQKHINAGLIEVILADVDQLSETKPQIRLTNKGIDWMVKRLLEESGQIPGIDGGTA